MSAIPGTTIADHGPSSQDINHGQNDAPIITRPGPIINGKQTTISLFSPAQLARSKFLPSLRQVGNEAFRQGHVATSVLPANIDRITSEARLLEELGQAPGTFTLIVHARDNDTDIVGTASMWRLTQTPVLEAAAVTPAKIDEAKRKAVFYRHEPFPEGVEGWELKLMVVAQNAQRQGLAVMLMDMCEAEVKRRLTESGKDDSIKEVRFVLTCIEEINGKFYRKRGFTLDSLVSHPPGTFDSPTGFTILHMSKLIDTNTI